MRSSGQIACLVVLLVSIPVLPQASPRVVVDVGGNLIFNAGMPPPLAHYPGPDVYRDSTVAAGGFGIGFGYPMGRWLRVGLLWEPMTMTWLKSEPDTLPKEKGFINAMSTFARAEGLFSVGRKARLLCSLALGPCFLVGSHVHKVEAINQGGCVGPWPPPVYQRFRDEWEGTSIGGICELGLETPVTESVGVRCTVGYRIERIGAVDPSRSGGFWGGDRVVYLNLGGPFVMLGFTYVL